MRLLNRRDTAAGLLALPALVAGKARAAKQLCSSVADAPVVPPTGPTCTPTVNPVPLVQFNQNGGGLQSSLQGLFPSSFRYFLYSAWFCCPADATHTTDIGFNATEFINKQISTVLGGGAPTFALEVGNNFLSTVFFNGTYHLPVNQMWNVIFSVDSVAQVMQVYANDAPLGIMSGGWIGSGMMQDGPAGAVLMIAGVNILAPAMGNVWASSTASFVDLTVVSNRRKFINADLSAANLGTDGSAPFGSPPPIYLTVVGPPINFLTNKGSGGNFILINGNTLTEQAPGTCPCPTS
jgi:hypothetical protein